MKEKGIFFKFYTYPKISLCSRAQYLRYSKICLKQPFKRRPKIGFQDPLSLNAGQKYCRMLQGEHSASAILWNFIKLPFVIKIFVLYIFEWLLKTAFSECRRSVSRLSISISRVITFSIDKKPLPIL